MKNKKTLLENKREILESKRAIPGNKKALLENERAILENRKTKGHFLRSKRVHWLEYIGLRTRAHWLEDKGTCNLNSPTSTSTKIWETSGKLLV